MLSPEAILFRRMTRSVFRTQSAVLRYGDLVNEPFGQSSARWWLLFEISLGDDSVASIARTTGNSRQAVQRLADALVAEHLATYGPNPTDRRKQVITLTDGGRKVLDDIETSFDDWSKRLVDQFGVDDLSAAIDHLDAIRRLLDRDIERIKESRRTRHD